MSRFAIIIESSNVSGQQDLPGARADAIQWEKFLKSNLGGSWSGSEIEVMHKPYSSDVKKLLEAHQYDYCFVTFSGHGFYSPRRKRTFVCLNDILKEFSIEELKPRGSRGTLVVDACRGTEGGDRLRLIKSTASAHLTAINETISIANAIRSNEGLVSLSSSVLLSEKFGWLANLRGSPVGIVTMYSCDIGEGAGEYTKEEAKQGGYYSSTLVAAAEKWSRKSHNSGVYTTKDAHDDVVRAFRAAFPQQNPQYEPASLQFPFAIK